MGTKPGELLEIFSEFWFSTGSAGLRGVSQFSATRRKKRTAKQELDVVAEVAAVFSSTADEVAKAAKVAAQAIAEAERSNGGSEVKANGRSTARKKGGSKARNGSGPAKRARK